MLHRWRMLKRHPPPTPLIRHPIRHRSPLNRLRPVLTHRLAV
jgi:hypothetical protein